MNLKSLIESADYTCRAYSGRGMFGKECLAVDLGEKKVGEFIADVFRAAFQLGGDAGGWEPAEEAVGILDEHIRTFKTDSMGRGQVIYFPESEWTEEDEVDALEEEEVSHPADFHQREQTEIDRELARRSGAA